jgi:hypothetical protein
VVMAVVVKGGVYLHLRFSKVTLPFVEMLDDENNPHHFTVQALTTRILNSKRRKFNTAEEERALAEFLKADDQEATCQK